MADRWRRRAVAALRERLSLARADVRGRRAPGAVRLLPGIDRCFREGGLPRAAVHELWAAPGHGPAAAGFALALAGHLKGRGDLVWVYPRGQARERGLPYGPGLMAFGHDPGRLVLAETPGGLEALWATEEALRATPPANVVVALDAAYARHAFMASRRLELAAGTAGASAFLLCTGEEAPVSAASLRWRVEPVAGEAVATSGTLSLFPARPRWRVAIERNRLGRCGSWIVEWNHESGRLESSADAGAAAAPLGGRAGEGEGEGRRAVA